MREIDRRAVGERIREIRLHAGLRQWEMARLLGTTQSAVHKYEHGIVPEPRRLLELARLGNTTVEWILTGAHWEGGSAERERLPQDLLRTAALLLAVESSDRPRLEEALRLLHEAQGALPATSGGPAETATLLEAAEKIHRAVVARLIRDGQERLEPR